jgi:hypothetical protein
MEEMDGRYFEFDGCGGMGRWRMSSENEEGVSG